MPFPLIPLIAGFEALKLGKQALDSTVELGKTVLSPFDIEDPKE